jgi:hypothetical protein
MAQAQLYKHDISRPLNPAVSVTDDSASTVKVEIEEYVFTEEILNGLFNVLDAVRQRSVSHTGIWINGYYGSGKSHFLKYLNFCLDPAHRERALTRMLEAVKEFDPLTNPDSRLANTIADYKQLIEWLGKAEIDTILFNIGDKVGDRTTNNTTTFAKAIWEEFNAFRGFHKFNIALAQYLEKPLQEKGKFDAFKAALAEDGFDWDSQAETLAITELDYVLEKASEVTTLSTDIIRDQIAGSGIDATPEKLSLELKSYVEGKGSNYRLLFFIDEVSQFIGSRQELLLQFQQIVTTIAKDCDKKVWIGCTAQQDLSEVLDGCQITDTSDQYGKILGRFQTRVALQGTNTEYITQKRILDKDEDAVVELGKIYDAQKAALEGQFNLPTGYRKYASKQDFIDYYPFVPYQFQLIMNVFDAFVALQYVDTEVKGNERSVLKITHKTAQDHSGDKIGDLISFDMMFGSMFEAGLKHDGQRAIRNANQIISTYEDKAFGQRVVNLLFMICNISDPNKLLFPATLENITTLMMTEIDQNKLALRDRIQKVLDYLKENSVVRVETKEGSSTEVYCFLTEEESEVNRLIKSQTINNNAMADALKTIFTKHITLSNKESFNGNAFSIAISIMERSILGTANANLFVEFKIDSSYANVNQFAFSNDNKKMVYYLSDLYGANAKLKNEFYWYCQVLEYLKAYASNSSEQRTKTNNEFRTRAADTLAKTIQPEFDKILDSCPIISGTQVIQPAILGSKKATDRYKTAIAEHFKNVYPLATYIKSSEVPTTVDGLKAKIRRPIMENEYGPLNPPTEAEKEIESCLNRSAGDANLADVVTTFSQPPYGWNEVATVYFINELVRRHMRAYSYKGNPNVDKTIVADTVLKDRNSYTITSAQKIDPQLVNDFIKAWKEIFNEFGVNYSLDSTELFSQCHNDAASPLMKLPAKYASISGDLKGVHAGALAEVLDKAVDKMNNVWKAERDPEKFFKLIIAEKQEGKEMMDGCKEVLAFYQNQMPLFSEIYSFTEDNKDNFDFITEADDKKLVEELKEIITDKRPDQNLPKYKKRRDILRGKLADIKKDLVKKIEDAYSKVLDELEAFAKASGVSFDRDHFRNITVPLTTTNNFYALQSNANTDSFKQEQIDAIIKQTSTPGAPVKRVHIHINQVFKAKNIHNEAEIDAYVAEIKNKLIEKLADNDELIVS